MSNKLNVAQILQLLLMILEDFLYVGVIRMDNWVLDHFLMNLNLTILIKYLTK